MASSFDRWEKDPYFSAAEEVQESADRYLFLFLKIIVSFIKHWNLFLFFIFIFKDSLD